MKIVRRFPRRVREIEHTWIRLADGTRLSARIWLPADADKDPVPAILEYLPYRHRDGTFLRDAGIHAYFAGHGYASLRVDIRGTGESDGVMLDEYLKQEQDDALEVIAWIARQPWCTGSVGMMGISWGGFNALQVAARRPPALKSIITVCSTDDRYTDDTHYMGGALLGGNMGWGCTFFMQQGRAPDPAIVGSRWMSMWKQRLKAIPHPVERWLRHPARDAFWKHGSVNENYGAIRCPVYAIGGWEDGYTNAVLRLMQHLKVPRKALIGPWAHSYPHYADLMPIGFLQESLRWWDHWLKGRKTGIMDEPQIRAWMQESVPPKSSYAERPGRWIAESGWPTPSVRMRALALGDGTLGSRPKRARLSIRSPETTGIAAGVWCPYGYDSDMPTDQREDDGRSLCFDSAPLKRRIELFGTPEVVLDLAVDRPQATIAVRLSDVAPDGAATRITYGLLNLSHRDGHARPKAMVPGRRTRVRLRLNDLGQAVSAGHRLRLTVSAAYWPMVWPSPEPVTLTLFAGAGAELLLPERKPRAADRRLAPFLSPEQAPDAGAVEVTASGRRIEVVREMATGRETSIYNRHRGALRFPHGVETAASGSDRFEILPDDPVSAVNESAWTTRQEKGRWKLRVETRTRLTSDRKFLHLDAEMAAFSSGKKISHRRWKARIARKFL